MTDPRLWGLMALVAVMLGAAPMTAATLYVAPDGNDASSGKLPQPNTQGKDGPFRTLERARDEIRKLKAAGTLPKGGLIVELQGGIYELAKAFELTADDSGTPGCPITYRSRPGQEVRLLGGRVITGWQAVTDPAVLKRVDPSARGKVVQADLRAQGVTDLGEMAPGQGAPTHDEDGNVAILIVAGGVLGEVAALDVPIRGQVHVDVARAAGVIGAPGQPSLEHVRRRRDAAQLRPCEDVGHAVHCT